MDGSGVEQDAAALLFRLKALVAARDRLRAPVRSVGVTSWALAAFMTEQAAAAIIFLRPAQSARRGGRHRHAPAGGRCVAGHQPETGHYRRH